MRNISAASLAKLSQKTGTEPVCIVEVEWNVGDVQLYGDKATDGVDGRIIQISSFDDILNIGKSGTTQSVTVTLSDTDGLMKQYFDNVDIHKKRVTIYQWFTGLPLSEKFVLFSGVVASPITWKEGDRTLTFSVISKTADNEVGFSPEEGQFPNLPEGLVGTVWALVFGQVMKLPATRIDQIPNVDGTGSAADSQTTTDHGIEDPSIDPHSKDQDDQQKYAAALAQAYFNGYLIASYTARKLGELDDFDDISKGRGTFSGLAKQFLDQGNKYLLQAQQIRRDNTDLKSVLDKQKAFNKKKIGTTNGNLFKQGVTQRVKIGDGVYTGAFVGNDFNITKAEHPEAEQYLNVPLVEAGTDEAPIYLRRTNFFWNPAGQRLALAVIAGDETDQPDDIRYIVSAGTPVTVDAVFAMRDADGYKQLSIVPANFYEVIQTDFGPLSVTMLLVPHALSTLTDEVGQSLGWEDDLYCNCTSPVGPNTVDIIRYLITEYTDHALDEASFAQVRAYVDAYPSHFAITNRQNVISLVQDIAYQARCIVWLKNNVFFIKYLSVKDPAIAEIQEADIIEQTLEVSYTETEDLTTKVTASWVPDYYKKSKNLVILRYNILQYGLHAADKDYYIYNMQQLVEKSAVFWLVRDSNTFKRVTLRVPIRFLNIETLDTVTLNFPRNGKYIANTAIDCVVEGAVLDTNDYTITLTLWCPVRAGEMEEYIFAYPGSLGVQYFWPTESDIQQGRAGGSAENTATELPDTGTASVDKPMTGDSGNGGSLHVSQKPLTYGPDPSYYPDDQNVTPQITTRIDNAGITGARSAKPEGTKSYQLKKATVREVVFNANSTTTMFPAKVVAGGPGQGPYELAVYMQGLGNRTTPVKEARQLQIDAADTIEADTWVMANRLVYLDSKNKQVIEWYIQVPVWQ